MFFFLSKTLGLLLNPMAWIILAMVITFFTRNPHKKKRRGMVTLILMLLLTNPWLSDQVFSRWESEPLIISDETYDVAVILTGMTKTDLIIGEQVQFMDGADRFIEPLRLYHQGRVKHLLISGGSGTLFRPDLKEGRVLQRLADQLKVAPEDLTLEGESRNTYENAKFTSDILKQSFSGKRVLLVTSSFHMRRAVACFAKQGAQVIPYPVDFRAQNQGITYESLIPKAGALSRWGTLSHEWFGYLVYKLTGKV